MRPGRAPGPATRDRRSVVHCNALISGEVGSEASRIPVGLPDFKSGVRL